MAKSGVNAGSGRPRFPWLFRDSVPPADGPASPAGPSLPDAEDREGRG